MGHHSNMTSKGQITVPKDIREALGLGPGSQVEFELNADGDLIVRKASGEKRLKQREEELIARVREMRAWFRVQDPMPDMDGLGYQRWIRGPGPDDAC